MWKIAQGGPCHVKQVSHTCNLAVALDITVERILIDTKCTFIC